MRLIASAVTLMSMAFVTFPAHAQIYTPPFNINHRIYVNTYDQQNANREDSEQDSRDDVIGNGTKNLSALNFQPSVAVRRKVVSNMLEQMRKSDPTQTKNVEALFSSSNIIDQIDQAIRPMGLRTDNVADAYAIWWVSAWKAANQKDPESSSSMYGAVKQQAASALLSTPQFASTDDAAKQEIAESMLIQAALIDAHNDAAAGNPAQQAALAKAVNQGAKKMGLDLTTMDLTENGFVPRSGKRSDASDADPAASEGAGTQMAANDNGDNGKLALYGVGGVALLAGMFALGKSFGGKG